MLIDGIGCWAELRTEPRHGQPALFLDRDGVIVHDIGYLAHPDDVSLIPGAAETIASFNRASVPVVVVTNQSGVGRGRLDWRTFTEVQLRIDACLAASDARIDAVFACGYVEGGAGMLGVANHSWRKPRPGMILEAVSRLRLDRSASWIVGDRARDLEAGAAAGLRGGTLVATGLADEADGEACRRLTNFSFEVGFAPDLRSLASQCEALRGICHVGR